MLRVSMGTQPQRAKCRGCCAVILEGDDALLVTRVRDEQLVSFCSRDCFDSHELRIDYLCPGSGLAILFH